MPRKPPADKQFKPGQSGNPGGRPKLPEDVKEARQLNRVEFERIVNRHLWMTKAQLQEAIKDPAAPLIETMVGTLIAKAIQAGDHIRLEFILCRLIGKVQERIEISTPEPFILRKLSGEEIVMGVSLPQPAGA